MSFICCMMERIVYKTLSDSEHSGSTTDNEMRNKMPHDISGFEKAFAVNLSSTESLILHTWHRRLAHAPFSVLQHIKCQEIMHCLTNECKNKLQACEACHKAKQTRSPFC